MSLSGNSRLVTLLFVMCALLCAGKGVNAQAAPGQDAGLLSPPPNRSILGMLWPSLSPDGRQVCFTYLGDLWTVAVTGGTATRLTVNEALDASAKWSPDGKWIAFTSERNGNADVFIIPSEGGDARQVTQHSGNDWLNDWSPDGTKLVFYSVRDTRTFTLFTIDLRTRAVTELTRENQDADRYAAWSPDGGTIAYTRGGQPWWRPWYRGSGNARTCLLDLKTNKIRYLIKTDTQQLWPLFAPDGRSLFVTMIYGKDGTPNIWQAPLSGGGPRQVTHYTTDAVRFPSIARNGSRLVYVWNGHLYTVKPDGSDTQEIQVLAHSDDKITNQERLHLSNGATEVEVSPDGKHIALVLRGSVWMMPVTGGDAQRLTRENETDQDISWSPDSTKLALISDRENRANVYTVTIASNVMTRLTDDSDDKNSPTWSPDGKWISFAKAGADAGLYLVPSGGGAPRRLVAGNGDNEFGEGIVSHSWSPDSRWIAFSRMDRLENRDIWIVPSVGGAPINITRYPGNNVDPRFTSDGRRLLFASDRNGPLLLFQVRLLPDEDAELASAEPDDKPPHTPDHSKNVQIDFDDIHLRARQVTPPLGAMQDFAATPDGTRVVVLIAGQFWIGPLTRGGAQHLSADDTAEGGIRFLPDGSRFFYLAANGTVRTLALAGGTPTPVAFNVDMLFDRRAQYQHAFNEFYRRFAAAFYDAKLHGAHWAALRERYEPMLEAVGTPDEFAFLLQQMVGAVNSSHSEVMPPPMTGGPQTASLGLYFDDHYAGPGLKVAGVLPKGPADRPESRVSVGDYILAIDGTDVKMTEGLYDLLQDKAGKTITLTVNEKPDKAGARTVKIKPVAPSVWQDLRYDADVRHSRDLVDHISGNKLAYIRIREMNVPATREFERELWGDAQDKDGLILDIRGNGGGNTHDQLLTDLERRVYGYVQPRDAVRQSQPVRAWTKPIVLLMDQTSYSDAEVFPAGFKALKLGKIVGVPTPGYVIGTREGKLMDGTLFRLPSEGFYTAEGKNMENLGITPDVYVENSPDDVASGIDRQLIAAIDVAMKEIRAAPKAP